jgi:hypothetical protein
MLTSEQSMVLYTVAMAVVLASRLKRRSFNTAYELAEELNKQMPTLVQHIKPPDPCVYIDGVLLSHGLSKHGPELRNDCGWEVNPSRGGGLKVPQFGEFPALHRNYEVKLPALTWLEFVPAIHDIEWTKELATVTVLLRKRSYKSRPLFQHAQCLQACMPMERLIDVVVYPGRGAGAGAGAAAQTEAEESDAETGADEGIATGSISGPVDISEDAAAVATGSEKGKRTADLFPTGLDSQSQGAPSSSKRRKKESNAPPTLTQLIGTLANTQASNASNQTVFQDFLLILMRRCRKRHGVTRRLCKVREPAPRTTTVPTACYLCGSGAKS